MKLAPLRWLEPGSPGTTRYPLLVVDDSPFTIAGGMARPRAGDFYRFALHLGVRAGGITICSPVFGRRAQPLALPEAHDVPTPSRLVPTFPYSRVVHYLQRLPLALWRNTPIFLRATRQAALVLIRIPAANAPLAFLIARLLRRPTVLLVVGHPAGAALMSRASGRTRSAVVRAAARGEWAVITWMARRSATIAYGTDIADRLIACGVSDVATGFTSLIQELPPHPHRPQANTAPRILYVGRLTAEKGVDVLLDAVDLLNRRGLLVHVDIVGDGAEWALLRKHPAVNHGRNITFHGWVQEPARLDAFFLRADIFVQPSRTDGIPKVLLNAMAWGLPIVATTAGGIPDVVTNGTNGLLVHPGDATALADALECLVSQPRLRERLGAAGRSFAQAHTLDRQADTLWDQINSLLERRHQNSTR